MKLINYNYGYSPAFSCSIHGKIVMSEKEWNEATQFLLRGAKRWLPSYPWVKETLKEDMKRGIETKEGTLFNIRVPATEALASKYNLKRYKRANYSILVK